jgi:S1-C subfamily serine protease
MNRHLVFGIGLVTLFVAALSAGSGGFLGVMIEPLEDDIREETGYDGKGIYVSDLVEEGPAEKAGLKKGDIITELNGDPVIGCGHLKDMLAYYSPGDKVDVEVWRNGKRMTIATELDKPKSLPDAIKKIKKKIRIRKAPNAWLGVKVQPLGSQLAAYFGVEKGVLVAEVFDESPAAKAGIEAGDVITRVDENEVDDAAEFRKLVGKSEPGETMSLSLVRSEKQMTLDVELGDVPEEYGDEFESFWFGGPHLDWLPFFKGHPGEVDVEIFGDDEEELDNLKEELEEELEDLREELNELKRQLNERE